MKAVTKHVSRPDEKGRRVSRIERETKWFKFPFKATRRFLNYAFHVPVAPVTCLCPRNLPHFQNNVAPPSSLIKTDNERERMRERDRYIYTLLYRPIKSNTREKLSLSLSPSLRKNSPRLNVISKRQLFQEEHEEKERGREKRNEQ